MKVTCAAAILLIAAAWMIVSGYTSINAIVKAADARIDKAVQAGHIDPSKAAERKSNVEARVTKFVSKLHVLAIIHI